MKEKHDQRFILFLTETESRKLKTISEELKMNQSKVLRTFIEQAYRMLEGLSDEEGADNTGCV